MKKALVMLLILAMLVPMCLTQPAKAEEAVTEKPFYSMGWSDFDEKTYPYLDGLYQLNWGILGGEVDLAGVRYGSDTFEADAEALANRMKTAMDKRPEGARYIHTFGPAALYKVSPDDALFMDFVVDQMAAVIDMVMKKYSQIGGKIDGIVVDVEYVGLSTYYLFDAGWSENPNDLKDNPNLLRDIVKNPKYKTEIRPLLEEWGFIFYDAGDPVKQASYTELFSVTEKAGSKYARSRNVWNTVVRIHLNNYVTKWAYEPAVKYFKDINVSDYQSYDSATWNKLTESTDDGTEMNGGNTITAGNSSTTSFYYNSPGSDELKHLTGAYKAIFSNGSYKNFMYEVNKGKNMYSASTKKKIAPWITSYVYGGSGKASSVAYTPYYSELLYHLGMLDPQPFLSYTYVNEYKGEDGKVSYTSPKYILTQQTMNDALAELTRVAGYSDRKPIELPMDWNSNYMISGMYANGRNIWRITPNTDLITLTEFLVSKEGEDPAFSVEGKTVTFPGGKIIADTPIENSGSCGYWVETAKDVTPVVTTEADRYEYYPSLIFDFEQFASGTFDYNTSKPKNAWGFTWSNAGDVKGQSYILNIDSNNKLAIIGNSKNWIKDLPANITAGDSYAEDQAWELYVTIPQGLSEDAKIEILTYKGNKQAYTDGGFKVQNGKLYYATGKVDANENPVYQELMDVDAGSTYYFKRIMNFHHENSFYCSYVVGNGNGRILKTVEEVPCPGFKYITEIGFGVQGADKAVYVDDFKIFLTGVTADFSVYDAKTGMDAEAGAIRDRSTAYRLSWLNATYDEHTATIKADITEGGKTTTTTLKDVNLVPGNDGVVTGIVDIKEGQTVKVYMETTVQTPVNPFAPPEEAGPLVNATFTEDGVKEVPEALKTAGLDTLDKIKEALETKLLEVDATIYLENMIHYDLTVDPTEIPKHGKMTVIMPYPAGTDSSYTFYVVHMFASDDFGKTVGEMEVPEVVNTSEGIQFEITGTSPILVGWLEPEEVEVDDGLIPMPPTDSRPQPTAVKVQRPTEAPETEESEEPTEETEYIEETEEPTEEPTEAPTETTAPVVEEEGDVNIVVIIVIAAVVLAGAGAAVFFLLKKKKAAASVAEKEIEDIEEPQATEEKTEE